MLAVLSTFLMMRSDDISRQAIAGLKRVGLRDLDHQSATPDHGEGDHHKSKILLLGFFRTASSFLTELERRHPDVLKDVCVVDFNPVVFQELKRRNVKVLYGDISHAESLSHASIADAEIIISSVPDSLLKGTSNEKLVRYVRSVNATAKIIATAEVFSQASHLYAAGADFVTTSRLAEAGEMIDAVVAAQEGLLADLREEFEPRQRDRGEVLP
jgi:voltage-gated potassium channel Kch